MNSTDAGAQARTGAPDHGAVQRLAELRVTLLAGRGPGASTAEVTAHTRDQPWLGSVPPPLERALVARQTEHLRAGTPVVNDDGRGGHRGAARRASFRVALLGAALALTTRALMARRTARQRRQPP